MKNTSYIRYPIYARDLSLIEKIVLQLKIWPIWCTVCGTFSMMIITNDNFRENCYCSRCKSFNRQRQIAFVLCNSIVKGKKHSLKDIASITALSVYNTETGGSLHKFLKVGNGYTCSEYFGEHYKSGEYIDGKMHQDLMSLSFPDNQFDYVISTDVFEHIAEPYVAHKEVYRVLKPGGRHIFTVPFYQTDILDEKRASIDADGKLIHFKEPWYHIDPIRPEGVLVFNIFSIEMLAKLAKIGFRTNMYHLYRPSYGILGPNGLVFEAIKETSHL